MLLVSLETDHPDKSCHCEELQAAIERSSFSSGSNVPGVSSVWEELLGYMRTICATRACPKRSTGSSTSPITAPATIAPATAPSCCCTSAIRAALEQSKANITMTEPSSGNRIRIAKVSPPPSRVPIKGPGFTVSAFVSLLRDTIVVSLSPVRGERAGVRGSAIARQLHSGDPTLLTRSGRPGSPDIGSPAASQSARCRQP
jgi:hypothetical protein